MGYYFFCFFGYCVFYVEVTMSLLVCVTGDDSFVGVVASSDLRSLVLEGRFMTHLFDLPQSKQFVCCNIFL